MPVQLYEIYNAKLPYKNSNDIRPVVIIEVLPANRVTTALISGAMDLYQGPTMHFILDSSHSDFPTTGLKKKCYVAGDQIYTVGISVLLNKRGQFSGELATEFSEWI